MQAKLLEARVALLEKKRQVLHVTQGGGAAGLVQLQGGGSESEEAV